MSRFSPVLRRALLAGCATALALSGPTNAQAQTPAAVLGKPPATTTYPANLDRQELLAWMKRETDITPDRVVAISPLALIAIMQTQPVSSPQGYEVTVRAEILDPTFARNEQLLSWHATIKLACADRTVSVGEATGHGERNLLGPGSPVEVTATGWKPVVEGTMQGQIWSARCDKAFKPPLGDEVVKTGPRVPAAAAQSPAPVALPPPSAAPPLRLTPQPAAGLPAAPAPTRPAVAARGPRPAPPPPAPKPAKSAAAAVAGLKSSVQIMASPNAAEAQHALTALKAKLPDALAGLSPQVVAVQTPGGVNHRAIVAGFKAPGDATRFCQKLTAAGSKCFVRGDGGLAPAEHAPAG